MIDNIVKYFPELEEKKLQKLKNFAELVIEWNQKINLISRNDIENIYVRHILHSLSIAKVTQFNKGCRILDVGTGGGFPGIPLAILFPEAQFLLVDSIGKKIMVVKSMAESLQLNNVKTANCRVEDMKVEVDFVVARAVTDTGIFYAWVKDKIREQKSRQTINNGMLYLKGIDQIGAELISTTVNSKIYKLSEFFDDPFFSSKGLLHIWKKD